MPPIEMAFDRRDAWDPMHDPGSAATHWSTDNVGEAAPGVLTPLSASIWGTIGDRMSRRVVYVIGAFDRAEGLAPPPGEDRIAQLFYGRFAMRMEYMAAVGDRMPGTTGPDAVRALLGRVPESMVFTPTRRRYPMIAYKLPRAMLTAPRQVRALEPEIDAWWRAEVPRLSGLGHAGAVALFRRGLERFEEAITIHSVALLSAVNPLLEAVTKLVARAGVGDVGGLSGNGGAEMAIIEDIWSASRGTLTLAQVVGNHGFHGPLEGEVASRVWREDPAPLQRMIGEYAAMDESQSPVRRDREARARLPERQREVLARLPLTWRPGAGLLLRQAARILPLRGVGKRSYLQSLDLARGSARRLGELLVADGALAQADDVFYLTIDELTGALPRDTAALVAKRRERRAEYQRIRLPGSWQGVPTPIPLDAPEEDDGEPISGLGVSSGVVEGIVRVVTDPSFVEVEPGEVLVTPTTDPSWASIMFLSAALVVDIGGPLSHAAVVARELAIPCVVNTRRGTRALRTGDRVRVDGGTGAVEVLERAAADAVT